MIESTLMYLFAGVAVLSALAMLVVRHPMRVAMALVLSMLSLAGVYALLGVHVIAVFQVLIYVGAVMVFMVYVIMLIDVKDRAFERFSSLAVPGALLFALLAAVFLYAFARSTAEESAAGSAGAFSVQAFSAAFLNEYWLYFELVSVLLVAAVVAAVAVVRIGGPRRG